MYKDKDKQKEAAKAAKRRWKAKQGIPDAGIPQGIPAVVTDTVGKVHPIDFEGRRRNFELLKSWHAGEGAIEQQALGELVQKYSVINGGVC